MIRNLEAFTLRHPVFRLGMQKSGELTKPTVSHYSWALRGTCPTYDPQTKVLQTIWRTGFGSVAVCFCRNDDLGHLVRDGSLDAAIIGTDTLRENAITDLTQIRVLGDAKWPFVYAYPADRPVMPEDAQLVATSFPRITEECYAEMGKPQISIVSVAGSVELMPYLPHPLGFIDAVTDIRVTGQTMENNGLVAYPVPLTEFKPVLIGNQGSLRDPKKKDIWSVL